MEEKIQELQQDNARLQQAYDAMFRDLQFRTRQLEDKEYELMGVMYFVDKWLEDDELKMSPIDRAIRMQEKTLEIVEQLERKNK